MVRLLAAVLAVATCCVAAGAAPPRPITIKGLFSGGLYKPVFSPDGKHLAVPGDKVIVFDLATGKQVAALEGHAWVEHPTDKKLPHLRFVRSVAYSPDGKTLATAGNDGAVILWDWRAGKEVRRLEVHKEAVSCVAFSPDGKRIATGGATGVLKTWDARSGKCLGEIQPQKKRVYLLAFSPDGNTLAAHTGPESGHEKGRALSLWKVADDKRHVLAPADGHYYSLAFSPDGKTVACGGDYHVIFRDAGSGKVFSKLEHASTAWNVYVGFVGEKWLAVGSINFFDYWDLKPGTKKPAAKKVVSERSYNKEYRLDGWGCVSPDRTLMAFVTEGGGEIRFVELPAPPRVVK